jgi:hypothetical protein
MSLLHDNINANFRILLAAGIDFDTAKVIVIRLAGKVVLDLVKQGQVLKVIYSDYGVRGVTKFNAVIAA